MSEARHNKIYCTLSQDTRNTVHNVVRVHLAEGNKIQSYSLRIKVKLEKR